MGLRKYKIVELKPPVIISEAGNAQPMQKVELMTVERELILPGSYIKLDNKKGSEVFIAFHILDEPNQTTLFVYRDFSMQIIATKHKTSKIMQFYLMGVVKRN